ncbi:hypothetical protein DE92_20875 [Salmonella enterica subsp. enterica serovar Mbandaka]|nr:hypothetical protein DE92_20875 [Salmonella enterica subsp. enterica serovar Mbandaka]
MFIPAGAGNTGLIDSIFTTKTVYPRWRGEHGRWADIQALCDGLSPLARGTLAIMYDELPKYRFIPADAGNTVTPTAVTRSISVYPRWRGEHSFAIYFSNSGFGLSPLARGTLRETDHWNGPNRFIPAGAGNTDPAAGKIY